MIKNKPHPPRRPQSPQKHPPKYHPKYTGNGNGKYGKNGQNNGPNKQFHNKQQNQNNKHNNNYYAKTVKIENSDFETDSNDSSNFFSTPSFYYSNNAFTAFAPRLL